MMEFDTTEIEGKILERLRNTDEPDAIITALCENYNLDWSDASLIVKRIQRKNQTQIVLAQSPILTLIALVIFLVGVAMCIQAIFGVIVTYKAFNPSPDTSGEFINLIGYLIYLISYAPALFAFFIMGIAMIIGSLKGMQDVWTALFQKAGFFTDPGAEE